MIKKIKKKPSNSCEKSKDVLNLQPQNRTRFLELGGVPEW